MRCGMPRHPYDWQEEEQPGCGLFFVTALLTLTVAFFMWALVRWMT